MKASYFWLAGLVIIATGSVFLALNTARRTVVLTTDSIFYVDTARHIAAGQGATTSILSVYDTKAPAPQTQWPPFYSMVMSPFIRAGMDPVMAGRVVSALSLGLTALLLGLWAWRLAGPLTGLAAAALLPTLPAITKIGAAVWADALYTLLVTGLVWLGSELVRKRRGLIPWFALGSLVGLSIITKYLGLLLFGPLVLVVLLRLYTDKNLKQASLNFGIALLGVLAFVGPLLLRNITDGRPIGGAARTLSSQTLGTIFHDAWSVLSKDFRINTLWQVMLAMVALVLLIIFLKRKSQNHLSDLIYLVLTVFVYELALISARFFVDTDRINSRFTMPIYPVLVLVFTVLLFRGLVLIKSGVAPIFMSVLALLAVGWSVKAYDFSAASYSVKPPSRVAFVGQQTTDRDLIISNRGREFAFYLGRTAIQLSDDTGSPKLTPEILATLKNRWSQRFDRIIIALRPDLDPVKFGNYTAALSRGETDERVSRLAATDAMILYTYNNL